MAINLYTLEELDKIAEAAVKANLPEIDPTIPGSFIKALVRSNAILAHAVQRNLVQLQKDFFPQTASGEYLDFWAAINNLTRILGTTSVGYISVGGTLGVSVPVGTLFSISGNVYRSTSVATVAAHSGAVALSASGATITAVSSVAHTLVDGMSVTISGASDSAYNGVFAVNVLDNKTYQYTALSAPSSPTDTGNYSATYANVPVESVDANLDKNASAGAVATLQSAVANLNAQGTVNGDGLTGGSDVETDDRLRVRVLQACSMDQGVFTSAKLKLLAFSVPAITRAFVRTPSINFTTDGTEVTDRAVDGLTRSGSTVTLDMTSEGTANIYVGSVVTVEGSDPADYNGDFTVLTVTATAVTYEISGTPASPASGTIVVSLDPLKNIPQPGKAYVFVLDDSNTPPSPSAASLTAVRNLIAGVLPAHTSADDITVSAPKYLPINITVTGLLPNTSTMRANVITSLEAFFRDSVSFASEVKRNKIIAAIQNTRDISTGAFVEGFTLTAPAADVAVGEGVLAILGTVTFA
jgi:uncharacterized phage protein gp47/JayE